MSSAQPPFPPPMPLSPLEYSAPLQSGRPGIVTAIGVMSIVVACLSGLACLWWVLMSAGFLMVSTIRTPALRPPAPTPPNAASVVPSGGSVTVGGIAMDSDDGSDGLPPAQRMLTSNLLARMGSLDAPRRKHLDLLLAVAGQKMFPSPGGPLTSQSIRRNISDFGVIPSAGGGNGTVFFVIGTGRIEVYDDHAIYRPDGSSEVVSASAPAATAGTASGMKLQKPPVPNASPGATWNQSWVSSGGKTTVTTTVNGRTSTTTYSGPPPAGATPFPFRINPIPAGLMLGESVVSFGLAIYLLIAGIVVLRNSLSGRKLHWIYVVIKIPLVILAIAASVWMWSGFFASMQSAMTSTGGPKASFGSVVLIWAVVGGAIALAYPVALIFALSSRTVRDYYNAVRA